MFFSRDVFDLRFLRGIIESGRWNVKTVTSSKKHHYVTRGGLISSSNTLKREISAGLTALQEEESNE